MVESIDQPRNPVQNEKKSPGDSSAAKKIAPKPQVAQPKNSNALPEVGGIARVFGKLLTSVKSANVTVSQNSHTRLPGYTDSTQFLGQNFRSMAPGFDFILGKQPDTNWLNRAARRGLSQKTLHLMISLCKVLIRRLPFTAQLEPVRDLNY